jgi:glycine oxidase
MKKVVIIGAGVAGLGIGWKLAEAGAEVVILERAQAGGSTTLASGGMIAAAAELGHASPPEAEFARRSSAMWPAFAAELETRTGLGVGYRRNGSLMVMLEGETPHGKPELGETNPHGADMLTAEQARAMEPMLAPSVKGALWAPDEASVDTHAMAKALIVAFERAGGSIQRNETAVRFELDAEQHIVGVRTPFGLHHADAYVLAAGAWSPRLEGLPEAAVPPIIPVKGEILVLEPPAGAELPKHVVWGNGIYLVPRGNRLLVGATAERTGYDTSPTPEATAWLRKQSSGLMPALSSWRISDHWVGLRPVSPDGMPLLGQSAVDGLFIAGGQYRNGILFAPAIADMMSRLVLERTTAFGAFDPLRFGGSKAAAPGLIVETAHRRTGPGISEWHVGF